MTTTITRSRRTRGALLLPLTAAILIAPDARAGGTDLVAGTISGTTGMRDVNQRGGNISISGGGFNGSAPVAADGTFSVTLQSPVVYTYASTTQYGYEPNYWYIGTSQNDLSLDLPEGGNVSVDLSTDAGIAVFSPVVSTDADGRPTGTITSSYIRFTRNFDEVGGYMWGQASGTGAVQAPVPVGGTIRMFGDVTVSVFDTDGVTSLCTAKIALAEYPFQPVAGGRTEIEVPIDIHPGLCETSIVGDIGSIGAEPVRAFVNSGGTGNVTDHVNFEGADVVPYALEGLPPGSYRPWAYIYYPDGEYMREYSYEYPTAQLESGQVITRDFVSEAAFVERAINITGPASSGLTSLRAQYSGQWLYDQETQTYSENSGSYSTSSECVDTGNSRNTLSEGTWEPRVQMRFQGTSNGASYQNYIYYYERAPEAQVTAVAGQTVTVAPKELSVSQGSVTFDVIEQPGEEVTTLSSPQLYIYSNNPETGEYININHYYSITNAETAPANIIAPPGDYNFTAYAYVNGTRSRFNSGSLSIGVAVGTPTGTGVEVVPKDENGDPSPIEITFDEVTTGGETTVSVTSVGPAAPDGYTLLEVVDESQFLNLSSSAEFTAAEICVNYDMTVLGITAEDESRLVLQVYTCDDDNNCSWTVLADGYVDVETDALCGTTSTLGTFGITLPDTPVVSGACVGTVEAPAEVSTDAGACVATGTGENGAFGSCDSDGLASCLLDGVESLELAPGEATVSVEAVATDGTTASCESYVTVVDDEAPTVSCAATQTLECSSTTSAAQVTASCDDNCGSCSTSCGDDALGLGTRTVSCVASDADGSTASCSTSVTVVDTTSPTLSMTASPTLLWPPNHKLVPIAISATSTDSCDDSPEVVCRATSNEADEGLGDGDFAGDIVWQDGNLLLRAERSGLGNDRVYTIECEATDASGNTTSSTQTVVVPHDHGGSDTEITPGTGKPSNKVKGKK